MAYQQITNPLPVSGTGTLAVQNTAATPAGTNIIGKVDIDQTTPGTTNGVQINAALPAGTNVIGHVINDAGSALIGKVGIDQTTPGTTNAVQDVADGPVSAGTAATKSTLAGGVFNTSPPAPTNGQQVAEQLDSAGSQFVNVEGRKATYSAQIFNQTAFSNKVNFSLSGSATKTVRITRFIFSANAGSAGTMGVFFFTASSAAAGGTSAANANIGQYDQSDSNATAVNTVWSVTGGTPPSPIAPVELFNYFAPTTAAQSLIYTATYSSRGGAKCPVLRGIGQFAHLELLGIPTGTTFSVVIEWTEE